MEPEFWLERWRNGQIGFHRETVHPLLARFWPGLDLTPGSRVFVPLCGKSRDLQWLAAQGYRVTGVEISPLAVEAFFRESGLEPEIEEGPLPCWRAGAIEIYCGDFFALPTAVIGDCAAVYDRAALVALPPAMRLAYAARLREALAPGTRILLVTLEYPQARMAGPPFSVEADEVRSLFAPTHVPRCLAREDVLEAHERFRAQGLDRLEEVVWRLDPLT
ncbi:MAG: thiopurine S-methyltransferase [Gammaproteobacteria bacterium]|nr:MAG: thiopurine S-methyltransferase [Gammaproteobacteria bacterium]